MNRLSILEIKDSTGYEYYFDGDSIQNAMNYAESKREHCDSDLYICQNGKDLMVKKNGHKWLNLDDLK